MRHFLFIADPLESFKVEKDSTLAMMSAALNKNHLVWFAHPNNLQAVGEDIFVQAKQIQIDLGKQPWFSEVNSEKRNLNSFAAVMMRKDPPFDMAYVSTTWLLSQATRRGAKVFNDPQALLNHSEKIALLEFAQFAPPTIVSANLEDIQAFHRQHKDIIIKPLDGMGGMGVFRVKEDGLNLASVVETLGQMGQKMLMAQTFLPEIKDGDKRVLVIGGEVVPHGLARIPKEGEIRGNLAAGGSGMVIAVTDQEKRIAQEVGKTLNARGLQLIGLDFIGGQLTEINVTSPTCFVEISQQSGHDVAQQWLTDIEKRC